MTPEDVIDQATAPLLEEINRLREGRQSPDDASIALFAERARSARLDQELIALKRDNKRLVRDIKQVIQLLMNRIALAAMGRRLPSTFERHDLESLLERYGL